MELLKLPLIALCQSFKRQIMSENDNEELDSTNQSTEEVDNTEAVEEDVADTDSEDLTALQEKNKRLFERAKKAEAEAKLLKAERLKKEEQVKAKAEQSVSTEKQVGLTPMDAIALMSAKVTEQDDIGFVAEYAQFKKISVSEALKSGVVKSELAQRLEQRQTASATNTGTARRGSIKPTSEQIMTNVSEGKYPEDPEALAAARFAAKLKK